ncbi:glycosyltransferase family 2 protein [Parahaliea mediterranea]|uniref:Glycosyltransferase family 2 protein n=1 Tax=Parahaliea mediterranea TaxID=651086 RepID=A0A939DBR3_9GAMM|nr:glycosyltransferase family 2 protein [Parahaliea mediterranea]MBN7795245.1 glycosyltransferase family 2 protein [Parahaliea mediterranea]
MKAETPPDLSIIIVSWNASDYLRECLQSIREEGLSGKIEVIVVDNASDDNSVGMVKEQFPETVLLCNSENLGFAKANNLGINVCQGRYIALVNSDVHILNGCLRTLVEFLEGHASVGLVGPFIIGADGRQQLSCRAAPTLWNMTCRALALDSIFPKSGLFNRYFMGDWDHASTASVDILSGCFWLTSRFALDSVGVLDESFFIYGEDMDWCKRFHDAGWDVVFIPQAKAIHYGGASSSNSPTRFFVEKQKADLQYWRKHHPGLPSALYSIIAVCHHSIRVLGYSIKTIAYRGRGIKPWYKVRRSAACLATLFGHATH